MIQNLKSFLFVPGDNPERIAKAAHTRADAVIIDLEDGVTAAAKPAARAGLPQARKILDQAGKFAIVRINAENGAFVADLESVLACRFDAIMVPKADAPENLQRVTHTITEHPGSKAATQPGLIALIESARGVLAAAEIATLPEVTALALGTEDFSLTMGAPPTPDLLDLPVRQVALAARAYQKAALALPLSIADFRDADRFLAAARKAAALGCTGALCIHPSQLGPVNTAFGPSDAEVAEADAIMNAWATAQSQGMAITKLDGRMIDAPVVSRAQGILRRAGRSSQVEDFE
ncbi:HpcH/HpaI aldolase/citrate lyase family protein [Hyphomonas johnsonii]|uniref:HpcH/HpaI aldolase/citrate lyase domain-containing protein n=1 Tax=Hyphomonas johnsonii MHS-2 TaxID=1280950 RepID=A0A059FUU2_9PROT|nr:CoA ester lyase [Hyphomonas johnsonii]KCZ94213.1 hypothetical protein HJO_02525 [Hyphomonas johnsonii MHS-2]